MEIYKRVPNLWTYIKELPVGRELPEKSRMKNHQSTNITRKFVFPEWRGKKSSIRVLISNHKG